MPPVRARPCRRNPDGNPVSLPCFDCPIAQTCQDAAQSAIVPRHLHPGGIPLAIFSFGCASCGSLDPGAGARATHASRRPPGVAFHGGYGPKSRRAAPGQPKPAGLKPPSEETIIGQELSRDGFAGIIAFQRGSGNGLEITRLSIAGEEISHPGEQCQVEVVAGAPIQTRFAGRPNGVSRYEVEIETCPFSLDVLEGAVLVTRTPQTCDFRAADCRADPAGLWGPPGNAIGPDQTKQLERERGRAEFGNARQVSRAADERRQGQRGHQANRQRTGGVLVGARSDLPQLLARGYSRILRAADHPGPCARLAGGVRGAREGKGETGEGNEETRVKFQAKIERQSRA